MIIRMLKADKLNEKAEKINVKSINSALDIQREVEEHQKKTRNSLVKLSNRKRGIVQTTIKDFIELYERIMRINFVESDGIKELERGTGSDVIVGQYRVMLSTAGHVMTSKQEVSTFLVGTVTGGLLGGFAAQIQKEAELNVEAARARKKQAQVVVSQGKSMVAVLDAISGRSDRMAVLLAKMNLLFRKSIDSTADIIHENGNDRLKYSRQDKEHIRSCMNFADAVKKVLDEPMIDQSGQITQTSIEVIQTGEDYIAALDQEIYSR